MHQYYLIIQKMDIYLCNNAQFMSSFEQNEIELHLKTFTRRNFERPDDCRNLEQVRFYVRELCLKIEELESKFSYVPQWAYTLLAQYNARQNTMLNLEFNQSYNG